ncbi:HAE1 family hydrophobic/amphiphilic exporter-1 [Angulomicrobium tetraedrale]|uniref:HAE1 family hydrophobic/amphiphilic exporter-1 n=1 Tax=Ancylobacter tetraedralis TaxID=217068 RepID=A0A839Z8Y9_9HYPH|nr:efflux RND transporter permease subunit [Ancylobacter tetraedralis]MBB3770875.1 HAE1 family hydrophobic/amphiphilic exporter-1 [Ancylobacter tetraedralis]
MALNISAWAIRKPVPSIVLFVVLTVVGLYTFGRLPITRMPNIDVPIVAVTIIQPGAAPSELETQVTKRVETAISGVPGVKHLTSSVTEGQSFTVVEFQLETQVDRAVNDIRDAVTNIRTELPQDIQEPLVQRIDVEGMAIATYAASAPSMTPEELSWFVDDTVIRSMQGVRGIAQVKREGGVDREVRISLDPDRLSALGVTAADVNHQVAATNVDLAGGRGRIGTQEQSVRTLGGATTVAQLAETRIALPGGRHVRLADLGTVTDGAAEPRLFARLDGKPVVAFGIYRAKGYSDVVVAESAEQELRKLEAAYPEIRITLIDSTVKYTKADYESAMHTLIEGAVLAVIVVFLFLRDWRATVVSALAIPLSILPTFWVMDMLGFSLNGVSLLAVTLVTGILVDDAIVEIENIVRHMRMGKSAYRASIEAADEIGLAVVATTLTIVAVFLPVSFMGGIAGQYFRQFGITVAVAVLFSLLVARLLTPMLAAYFMRDEGHRETDDTRLMRWYVQVLRDSVRHRYLTVAGGIVLFIASMWLSTLLPSGFIPSSDVSRSVLALELPPGDTLDQTRDMVDEVSTRLKAQPEVASVYATGGSSSAGGPFGDGGEVNKATVIINLVPRDKRDETQKQFEHRMVRELAPIPDLRFSFGASGGVGPGGREFTLVLSGSDGATVDKAALELEREIRANVKGLSNVVSTVALERPELRVVPKLAEAAELGVSVADIAQTVRIATIGDIAQNLAKFSAGDRQVPIRVQLDERARADISTFEMLRVRTGTGASVPLSAVADISFGTGPSSLDRYDRARRVAIEGDLAGYTQLGEALEEVYALPAARNLPAGVVLKETGDAEIMGEVFSGFTTAMSAGILMVFAVLVLLFANVLQPITILIALPLSVGGAFVALLLTNNALTLPVVIGFLMLMGIVTKNTILLVDFAIEAINAGEDRGAALIEAGRKRAQPIIMTTIAMVAGMMPSALGIGEGGDFRSPMAIAVIGGLLASTALSLVFVPAVFTLIDDLGVYLGGLLSRFVGETDEPPGYDAGTQTPTAAHPAPHPVGPPMSGPAAGPRAVGSLPVPPRPPIAAE